MNIKTWILASRPKTLPAAIIPVLVGTSVAYASGQGHILYAILALFGAVAIQVATNFVNDLFDFKKGADTEERLGPTRAVQAGLLSEQAIGRAAIIVFGFAFGIGLLLTARAGWPILLIGILSILSGICYTAGPYPLAYNGLGDVFVFIFFGFVAVAGTYYVQAMSLNASVLLAAIPIGALASAILVVNNVRDEHQDKKVSKKTLVVRFGRLFGLLEYLFLLLVSYGTSLVFFFMFEYNYWVLLPWLSFPLACRLMLKLKSEHGQSLNLVLAQTAQLLIVFGLLWAASLAFVQV